MKRLIKTVDLIFFQDDANGEFGLAHKETYNESNNPFNAFWSGMGIFHDVFEHSHEFTHKYFRGDYAMNIGGEMAAMGSMLYYIDEMGISNRLRQGFNWRSNGETMRESTFAEVHEAISSGYCNYGYTLESNVPKQRPSDNGELEYQIAEYYKKVKTLPLSTDENEREFGRDYKKSVTFRKIADLHRYGYRMAAKLVPHNWDNVATLTSFITFWDNFTKNNSAEEMQNSFKGLTIKLYKDENGFISWKGVFKSRDKYSVKDAMVTENTKYFDIYEYYVEN
jgi:hypothetical protein